MKGRKKTECWLQTEHQREDQTFTAVIVTGKTEDQQAGLPFRVVLEQDEPLDPGQTSKGLSHIRPSSHTHPQGHAKVRHGCCDGGEVTDLQKAHVFMAALLWVLNWVISSELSCPL